MWREGGYLQKGAGSLRDVHTASSLDYCKLIGPQTLKGAKNNLVIKNHFDNLIRFAGLLCRVIKVDGA